MAFGVVRSRSMRRVALLATVVLLAALWHLGGGTSAADGSIFFRGTAYASDTAQLSGTLVDDAGVAVPQTFDPTQAGGPF